MSINGEWISVDAQWNEMVQMILGELKMTSAERDRYRDALLAIVHQEWQGATAIQHIARAALEVTA